MRTALRGFITVFVGLLFGCSMPREPVKPSGENRTPVNTQSAIADVMARYYHSQKEAKERSDVPRVTAKLAIKKVLEQYIPADFVVFADASVDLGSTVNYEAARPWPEAFGDSLAEVDIDMTADLSKRVMTLKTARLTVAQVLAKYVPADYTVFADSTVNMGSLVTFDRSISWTEGLGKALSSADITSTTNLKKKMVVLRSNDTPAVRPGSPQSAPHQAPIERPV